MFIYILLLKMSIVFDPYCFLETSLVFSAFFEEPSMPMTYFGLLYEYFQSSFTRMGQLEHIYLSHTV